ncbi:MAG: arsenate reductase (glutaredoxin) [Gammaproteobacteria bacterium]|nr:arsenate reductase (glutaredoxin) [Gammaproteobacteria bacterium]
MSEVTIYHNPRCSKSRQTLALLEQRGIKPNIVNYLDTPPDAATLKALLSMLELDPRALMRRKEAPFSELSLDNPSLGDDELVAAMIEHPILIERPIVVVGNRAAIGRPPEDVLNIL